MKRPAPFHTLPRPGRHTRALVALAALALLPACAETQTPEAGPLRAEVRRVEAELAEIESRALRDPELLRIDETLGAELMAAMVRVDPGLPAAAGQLSLLQEEYGRAIQAGDAAAGAEVNRRIAAIEQRYLRAQKTALRDPSLARRADRFNALLRRRMIETDRQAEGLLARYAELRGRLEP